MRFFLSPLLFLAGVAIMKYSVQVTNGFSGKIDFAEKYLTAGFGAGTYTFWRLFGLLMCILAVLWLFGFLGSVGNFTPAAPQ